MAALGSVEAEIRSLPANVQPPLLRIFRDILKNIRFGHPTGDPSDPAENFSAAFLQGRTPAVADTEFSIAHGFGRVPYLLIPVLPLDTVNAAIVPLTVSRAADDRRIYLTSSETDTAFTVFVEG